MTNCWILNINNDVGTIQNDNQLSFIGGLPRIPKNISIPDCELCGHQQTFFLQVALPDGHEWFGFTLAIFSCTSCANEEYLIPEMLQTSPFNANIPKGFLEGYQKNFRFLLFNTDKGVLNNDYLEKIIYKPIDLKFSDNPNINENKIGGVPNWILENESPRKYNGSLDMFFLMQIKQDFEFKISENAPPQIELDLSGRPSPSSNSFYQLFNGNFIYLFGVDDRSTPLVYTITQVD